MKCEYQVSGCSPDSNGASRLSLGGRWFCRNSDELLQKDDVFSIPDLTDYQKSLLKANLKSFTMTDPAVPIEKRMPPRITQPAH
jgi:hypothetical protein